MPCLRLHEKATLQRGSGQYLRLVRCGTHAVRRLALRGGNAARGAAHYDAGDVSTRGGDAMTGTKDNELMLSIKNAWGRFIAAACDGTDVPAAFVAALIAGESGGRNDAKGFEKKVWA